MTESKKTGTSTPDAEVRDIQDLPRKAEAFSDVEPSVAEQVTGGVSPCDKKTYPSPVPIPYPN